jgi:L-histidine Nalpha-methyltransferase
MREDFASQPAKVDRMTEASSPQFHQLHDVQAAGLADEAAAGLLLPQAAVSPKFFYDALGSRLFDAITELDEYYPTRTEAALMQQHAAGIAQAVHQAVGAGAPLVDLGAGSCMKAARLFATLRPSSYLALDISVDYLRQTLGRLQREHPSIRMLGVGLDFSSRLALPPGLLQGPALVFYPGSSIGNFDPQEALSLLRQARALSAGSALLIGVDLVKDTATLEAAYDDALGVTAAFNLNLLLHLNRLLGADFDPRQWRHVALFNTGASRIEMHLAARQALTVRWRGGQRHFAAGEYIHTENSYKWQPEAFAALLQEAGFARVQHWQDERGWFSVMLASG